MGVVRGGSSGEVEMQGGGARDGGEAGRVAGERGGHGQEGSGEGHTRLTNPKWEEEMRRFNERMS